MENIDSERSDTGGTSTGTVGRCAWCSDGSDDMEILSSSKSSIDVRGYPGYDNNICDIDTKKG